MKLGMEVVDEDNSWNLYWSDLTLSIERAREMKRFQVIAMLFCSIISV
jgi:tubulin polyglutamylase TTLL6/13